MWNWHHISEYSNYVSATLTNWRPLGSCPAGATLSAALSPLILAIGMKCKEKNSQGSYFVILHYTEISLKKKLHVFPDPGASVAAAKQARARHAVDNDFRE